MSEYNLYAKSRNKNERRISLNKADVDSMKDWIEHYEETYNPPSNPTRKTTKEYLNKFGPMTKLACEIWILVPELEQIKYCHKWYVKDNEETEQDKHVIKIVEEALNPVAPPPKEKKA